MYLFPSACKITFLFSCCVTTILQRCLLQILDVNAYILEDMICAYFRFSIDTFDINNLWAVHIILDLLTKIVMPH